MKKTLIYKSFNKLNQQSFSYDKEEKKVKFIIVF